MTHYLPIGTSIDNMCIRKQLWTADHSAVYEVTQGERRCALKVIHTDPQRTPVAVAHQLLNDGLSRLARLQHRMLPLYERAGIHEGCAWISMELLSGAPLQGPMEWQRAVPLIADVARLLGKVAAQGIPLVDVKLENLWRCPDGSIRVLDLEGAFIDQREQRRTTAYCAPECWTTTATPSEPAAIYALSLTLANLLHGRHPLSADTPTAWRVLHCQPEGVARRVCEELIHQPPIIYEWLKQGLSRRPEDREQSLQAWADRISPPQHRPERPGQIIFSPPPPTAAPRHIRFDQPAQAAAPGSAPRLQIPFPGATTGQPVRTPDFEMGRQVVVRHVTDDLLKAIPPFSRR